MDFANAYALLVVVSTPVSIVMGMNVWLYLEGERGTLVLPLLADWPSVPRVAAVSAPVAVPTGAPAANDEPYRLAA